MILITGSQTDDEDMRHLNDSKVSSAPASARSPYTVTLSNVKTTAASSRGPDTSPAQPSPAQPSTGTQAQKLGRNSREVSTHCTFHLHKLTCAKYLLSHRQCIDINGIYFSVSS